MTRNDNLKNRKIIIPHTGSHAKLDLIESELPALEPNQILVKTEACGVAFADILMREGLYPDVDRRNLTPGYDVVGEIVQVGNDVSRLTVGDRVACLTQTGGYADYTVAQESLTVLCPRQLPAQQVVAIILNYTTAYQMLTRIARVTAGERILVHGVAGGVGSALLELGLHLGLTVYGTLSQRKWALLPAHLNQHPRFHKLDYQTTPFEEALVKALPEGVDVVFDAIGGSHLKRSYQSMRIGGTVVSYGFSTAIKNGRRNWWEAISGMLRSMTFPVQLIRDNKTIAGYGIWIYANAHPLWFREDLTQLIEWLEQGVLKPMVSKQYALTETAQAQERVSRSELPGKVVLAMGAC
ncbi:zinc-binding dehydrogenase [Ketobacter sp. MCCC 1A13808]|uniref:zinc-binding dehydrogenase n=1 Tax=Ketobacter sp. MCCC 1A13808 TaxID=2602738 RepID=UPI0012EB6805|nr:zinc-binding dehydrogenase [Ketobacter sp. MCCC 1A13808]MVF14878.1 zinc-binding dehydrogenase [Ketobacter sp. MCCC 1A13808]